MKEVHRKYLAELESGVHHSGISRNDKKPLLNSIFVNAALAVGFAELTAKNHRGKIDKKIGESEVMRAFELGFLRPQEQKNKPKKKKVEITKEGQNEIFSNGVEFGNAAHVGLARAVGVVGEKGVRFMKVRGECGSDREAMLMAGFTESQAAHPSRLREKMGKLSGQDTLAALQYLGVDSLRVAEVIEDFLSRREVVTEERLNEDGRVVLVKREQYQGASASAGLNHLKDFLKLSREEGGLKEEEGIAVPSEVVSRVSGFLRAAHG